MSIAIISLAFAASLVAVLMGSLSIIRSLVRSHARERDLLINQLLHAAGKPWQSSPESEAWLERARDDRGERRTWTATPEQYPIN